MATNGNTHGDGPPPGKNDGHGKARAFGGAPNADDPYYAWAMRTRFRYLGGEPEWVPLLARLSKLTVGDLATTELPSDENKTPLIFVPSLFRHAPDWLKGATHVTFFVNQKALTAPPGNNRLLDFLNENVARYELGMPVGPGTFPDYPGSQGGPPDITIPEPAGNGPHPPEGCRPVVIGAIDDAIAYAHDRFKRPANAGTSTRIEYLWIQDITAPGRVLTRADINGYISACEDGGLVDETEVYRLAGTERLSSPVHKMVGRRCAHGTHVLDIAAGYDPAQAPSHLPIIGVQLPGRIVRDTSGAWLTTFALWGIWFIVTAADTLAGNKPKYPVVVNLSYGLFAGPHDGTSVFEMAVDEYVSLRNAAHPNAPLCVVVPAGNNLLWRTHAHYSIASGESQDVNWRVVPDDRTISSVEFWLSAASGAPNVAVSVTAPDGTTSGPMLEGAPTVVVPPGSGMQSKWQLMFQSAAITGSRPKITLIAAPTAPLDPFDEAEPVAPSGIWQITLQNNGARVKVEGRIERDDTPFGWPILGRQSYFDDSEYVRFDASGRDLEVDTGSSYVKRKRSLNRLATGNSTFVIAGCRRSDYKPAKYSTSGPIDSWPGNPPPRVGPDPDAEMISDDSVACRGVLAAGTHSNSVFAMNGTSVAAPQATRWIAGQMATGNVIGRSDLWAFAAIEEGKLQPPHPPGVRIGAGRIDDQEPPAHVTRWERL